MFEIPNETSRTSSPPSAAATFAYHAHLRSIAPNISPTNTSVSSQAARVKTSSVAE